jgi:two-component system response regulator (stage 0 sporulation protein F)
VAKLLIVDDEADVREFAANFFRKRKVETITAASAEEALSLFQKEKPHLVLLDIKMGNMDGIEALRRLKEIDKEARVVMVTGKKPEEEQSFKACKELGALDYIHKPLELEDLERVVMGLLSKPGK